MAHFDKIINALESGRTAEQQVGDKSNDPAEKRRYYDAMHDSSIAIHTGSKREHQEALKNHKDALSKATTPEIIEKA